MDRESRAVRNVFTIDDVKLFDTDAIERASPYKDLIPVVAETFKTPPFVPERAHHNVSDHVTHLSMPSWRIGEFIGHKLVNIGLENTRYGVKTVNGLYLLFDAKTGVPRAMMDAAVLTNRRTAAVSACAADIIARKDANTFLMIGTGGLAREFLKAHSVVRDYQTMQVWGRDFSKAKALCAELAEEGFAVTPVDDLEGSARDADVISCATTSTSPIIAGAWLKAGSHLDLAGAFKPHMAECDGEAIRRGKLYVDNRVGALNEAGEIVQAIKTGLIDENHVAGDLSGLLNSNVIGRKNDSEITIFKSVGTAISDYATAKLVYSISCK
jgi:ornithine cyclodeaminase